MTSLQWLSTKLYGILGFIPPEKHQEIIDIINDAKKMERQQLFNAMKHALDEDGHNGTWVIEFIDNYINKLSNDKSIKAI